MGREFHGAPCLNINIRHAIRAAQGSVVRVGGSFNKIRHSLVGVREVGNLTPGGSNLWSWVRQVLELQNGGALTADGVNESSVLNTWPLLRSHRTSAMYPAPTS